MLLQAHVNTLCPRNLSVLDHRDPLDQQAEFCQDFKLVFICYIEELFLDLLLPNSFPNCWLVMNQKDLNLSLCDALHLECHAAIPESWPALDEFVVCPDGLVYVWKPALAVVSCCLCLCFLVPHPLLSQPNHRCFTSMSVRDLISLLTTRFDVRSLGWSNNSTLIETGFQAVFPLDCQLHLLLRQKTHT